MGEVAIEKRMQKARRGILDAIQPLVKDSLFSAGKILEFKKGDIIFDDREEIDDILFVINGFVSLYKNCRYGESKIVFICARNEALNEDVLRAEKTAVAAKALADTSILKVPKDRFLEIMSAESDLMQLVFESIAKKTRRLYHQVGNANGTYPLDKHVASKIWKLARDYGVDTSSGRQVEFEITVTFLASMLGAKRESVSRVVSKLKKEGIITHENGVLVVHCMERIRDYV